MFANQNAELIVGQFCADFIRGTSLDEFPDAVRQGIVLHRAIDGFTDRHPVNLEARRWFVSPYRRFAGILTDVVYDHYLARNWSLYSDVTLHDHVAIVHDALDTHFELLPLGLQRFARYVIDKNVLVSYLHFDAVEDALSRISRRSERFLVLDQAGSEVNRLDTELSGCFARFYPDLMDFVATLEQK